MIMVHMLLRMEVPDVQHRTATVIQQRTYRRLNRTNPGPSTKLHGSCT